MMWPEAFVQRMNRELGSEAEAFFSALEQPPVRGIRMNPMKPIRRECLPDIGPRVPWTDQGFELDIASRLGNTVPHEAGAFYLQDPSSMLPASVLSAQPGERVLDLCAAPGGKSTQLAAQMQGQGLLVCNEVIPKRAQVLSRNLERMGVTNALCISMRTDALAQRFPEAFDAVLVDAPCSGEGMFRKHPETVASWSPEMADGCAVRQKEILESAACLLSPGGRMVYSTCTYHRRENEEQVKDFLKRHPEFSLAPFPGGPEGMLTCYPHRMRGEGQFCALLVKADTGHRAEMPLMKDRVGKESLNCLQAFSALPHSGIHALGDTLFYLPECPELAGMKVWRAGIHLGTVRAGRLLPDHAWAVSWMPPSLPRLAAEEDSALAFLRGETFDEATDKAGYVLVTWQGLVLGLGKVSGGTVKNHYPKGLRRANLDRLTST